MSLDGWTRHQGPVRYRRVRPSPHIAGRGHGSVSTKKLIPGVVRRARVTGFTVREPWGEGDWTARDLR